MSAIAAAPTSLARVSSRTSTMTASDAASIAPLLSASSHKAFSYDADVAAFLRAHTAGMSVGGAPLRSSAPLKASKSAVKPAKTAAPSVPRSQVSRDAADAKPFEYDQDVASFLRRYGAGGNGQMHAPGTLKMAQPGKTASESKTIRRLFRRSG